VTDRKNLLKQHWVGKWLNAAVWVVSSLKLGFYAN